MNPFELRVAEAELVDLRARLKATRWPPAAPGPPSWEQGTELHELQALVAYWAEEYDWREAEAELNTLGSTTTVIDGAQVYFLHVTSSHPRALPLVLTHGWPGSIVEFLGVIGPLVDPPDPADAFHVVIPSLPGFGLSGPPPDGGWDPVRIARAWSELMHRLGYERFGAQGGDWGSRVSRELGRLHPERVAGVHVNYLPTPVTPRARRLLEPFTVEERDALDRFDRFGREAAAYNQLQATRPQTLAYALTDSPAGQLAWILEKLWAWTDTPGLPLDRDKVLTNVMLYWLTRTAGPSARLYLERARAVALQGEPLPSATPTGVAVFPAEINTPVRRIAELTARIVRWTEMPRGGHFAAWEEPALLVDDVRAFFRPLR